jgi:hypothetical protein
VVRLDLKFLWLLRGSPRSRQGDTVLTFASHAAPFGDVSLGDAVAWPAVAKQIDLTS